jgi:hypothetical protein
MVTSQQRLEEIAVQEKQLAEEKASVAAGFLLSTLALISSPQPAE